LVAGTAGYGVCGGSGGSDSGRDSTTPTGAAPTRSSPFNSSCDASTHNVGVLTVAPQSLWSVNDPTQNAFLRLYVKAAISNSTVPHNDYSDTLKFIATGTY
jgi:septal ring-binding cell division protein DamX